MTQLVSRTSVFLACWCMDRRYERRFRGAGRRASVREQEVMERSQVSMYLAPREGQRVEQGGGQPRGHRCRPGG